MKIKKNRWA